MRLIAHRGFAAIYPENTRRAFEEAVAVADEVEVDVRRCASGELVVIHDETVDRVTDAEGAVADLALAELRDLDVLGTGEGVPTLAETLQVIPEPVGVTLDLKEEGTAADALEEVAAHHPQAVVSSFSRRVLADARDHDASVPRALITAEPAPESVAEALELDCEFVHAHVDVCTERFVGAAHRAGASVNAWTVDALSEAEELADLGVDGVIADRWGILPEAAP